MSLLSKERLAEFKDLAACKLTEYRRAVMLAEGEHGSHVWCYDPRPDGSGPLNLHSEECHLRTLLAHIDAQQAEIDRLNTRLEVRGAFRDQCREERDWLAAQVAALREVVRRANHADDCDWHDDAFKCSCGLERVYDDTEAAAREHDQRLRLEGAEDYDEWAQQCRFHGVEPSVRVWADTEAHQP